MPCKFYWIVLYTVHFTAFCLGGGRFFPDTVYFILNICTRNTYSDKLCEKYKYYYHYRYVLLYITGYLAPSTHINNIVKSHQRAKISIRCFVLRSTDL